MSGLTVTHTIAPVELDPNAILKRAWRLYKRLFTRSLLMGGVVFGTLHLVEALARSGRSGLALSLLTIVLALVGTALLQGGLVEIVRGLHVDGDDDASAVEALRRASGKLLTLVGVSFACGLAIAFTFLVPVVVGGMLKLPMAVAALIGLLAVADLMTLWAVAVPVAMLEDVGPLGALNRSRALVRGNRSNVLKLLFSIGVLMVLVAIPFSLLSAHSGIVGWWITATLASMLTAPYSAHVLTVLYYALVEPERPVVLGPGHRWQSVWDEQHRAQEAQALPPQEESIVDEYERRFDDHNRQWER